MAVLTITKDNFQTEVMQSDKPVLLDFWAKPIFLPKAAAGARNRGPMNGCWRRAGSGSAPTAQPDPS